MSFGYGVGDIMAISGLALKVYTAYKDAPGDYRNISDEVESLHIIIKKAAQHFESPTLSDNSRQEGQKVLKGCQNVLEDLDVLIIKYNSLASSASSSQVLQRIKLGAEDIATLRVRLISNTTLLNGFIQSCDSDKIQARLDSVLGLRRTMSRDSVVSFAGSLNTKKAYKKFCKGLLNIGVTAEMISQKEKEIQDIFKPQHPAASNQTDDSTFVDLNLLPEVGTSSDQNQPPEVGTSSDAETATMSTENPKSPSRFSWIRPPIDFLVGPLMVAAAETGNTKRLISTLEYVRDINFAGYQKETALHKAAAKGHEDLVQLLLSKGASIEALDEDNYTPLHFAASHGHTSIVELLLSKGASIEAMDKNNYTPLHFAAMYDYTSMVELLLSKGASIEAMDKSNATPLHFAARYGHTSIVELLVSKGASIEAMDEDNYTPLHFAARDGHTSIVELLVSKGASTAARNKNNVTPLGLATIFHRTGVMKLFEKKATLLISPGTIPTIPG